MLDTAKLKEALKKALKYEDGPLPEGGVMEEIAAFSKRNGIVLPDDFVEWVKLCNGPPIWPAGLCGISTKDPNLDVEEVYRIFPDWRQKGWLPVGDDGAGNYYIIPTRGEHGPGYPVLFIEADHDYSPGYIVASDLAHFLDFLLEAQFQYKALGREPDWPFDEGYVISRDPQIVQFQDILTPWGAEKASRGD